MFLARETKPSYRDLLAKTLMAEAGGEGVDGMLAAGAVINNRVKAGGYGDNIQDVIMKPGQFSAWNGVTGYAGGEGALDMGNMTPSEDAYRVADMLLSGQYEDPTGGATHYYNPAAANPAWGMGAGGNWQKIGNHVFGRADAGRNAAQGVAADTMTALGKGGQPMNGFLATKTPEPEKEKWWNPDRRDHLISALEGMTMNPNQGMIAAAQKRIGQRADQKATTERANRTAEWLKANGRPDLAEAVLSGAVDGKTAAGIALTPAKDDRTAGLKEYEAAVAQGFKGTFLDYKTALAKAGATSITNNLGQGAKPVGTKGAVLVEDPTAPSGYRMEYAANSEAERDADAAAGAKASEVAQAEDALRLIQSIKGDPKLADITGTVQGNLPAGIPLVTGGQEGADLGIKVKQLQGKAFLQAFETLKGGGQITEREGIAAQNAIARLDRVQSHPAYIQALTELEEIVQRGLARSRGEEVPEYTPKASGMSDEDYLKSLGLE